MQTDGDDLFGDLLGSNSSKAGALTSSAAAGKVLAKQGKDTLAPHNSKPLSDVFSTAATNGSNSMEQKAAEAPGVAVAISGVSKEELHAVVSGAVQAALDAQFGKFVKSLRTVLEDLGKRVDNNAQSVTEVKAALTEFSELLDSQAQNYHSRFHNLDMSIKEIDRGVQALRDKQELHEAQAMLAKLANPEHGPAGPADPTSSGGASAAAPAALPAPAAAPVPTPAPAPAPAPAPTPAQAPAPQPVAAPPVTPALVPAAAPPPQPQQYLQPQQPVPGPQQYMQVPAQAATPTAPQPLQEQQQQLYAAPAPQYATYQAPQASAPAHAPAAPPPASDLYHSSSGYPHAPPTTGPQGVPHYAQGLPNQQMHSAPPMPAPMPQPAPLQQQPSMPLMPPHGPPHSGNSWMGPQLSGPSYPSPASSGPSYPAPVSSGPSYPAPALSYPAPPQVSAYPQPYRQAGPPGPPPQLQTMSSSGGAGGGPARTNTRSVRLDDIISDITAMGFERHQVMSVINNMQKAGQAVDLNVVIDRLTKGQF